MQRVCSVCASCVQRVRIKLDIYCKTIILLFMKIGLDIGLDIHGVIDTYPYLFRDLSLEWENHGHRIHIITGEPRKTALPTIIEYGICYNEFFSIVDYHIEQNTPSLSQDENGHYWVDREVWMATKGNYAERVDLDIHFDDQIEYAPYFPKSCSFIYVPPSNFEKVIDTISVI